MLLLYDSQYPVEYAYVGDGASWSRTLSLDMALPERRIRTLGFRPWKAMPRRWRRLSAESGGLKRKGMNMSGCGLHCLKIQHITVWAGDALLLDDVNLHAHCGELTAIIGRNGAGKSTLLKAILGELPHKGMVEFSGHSGSPVAANRGWAMCPSR